MDKIILEWLAVFTSLERRIIRYNSKIVKPVYEYEEYDIDQVVIISTLNLLIFDSS